MPLKKDSARIEMAISQLLVNQIEWNKFHFVENLIAFKMNTNLTSDYTSVENLIVHFILTQSVQHVLGVYGYFVWNAISIRDVVEGVRSLLQ